MRSGLVRMKWSVLALIAFAGVAMAQTFPSRPITVIWPYSPGSGNEVALKYFYEETGKLLGQPMLVDYRPGAGGRLGVQAVSRAPADGYLMSVATDALLCV